MSIEPQASNGHSHSDDSLCVLEDVCDRFERDRRDGAVRPIESYLPVVDVVSPQTRNELVLELVSIELEQLWRDSQSNHAVSSSGDAVALHPFVEADALAESYFRRFPQLRESAAALQDVVQAEFRARQAWGDAPFADEYQSRFAEHFDQLLPKFLKIAAQVADAELAIFRNRQVVFDSPLNKTMQLGRQKVGEPAPFYRIEEPNEARLIVSPSGEQRMSRCQLELQVQTKTQVLVKNCSQRSTISIDGKLRIGPSESKLLQIPFDCVLPGQVVRCRKIAEVH